MKTRTTFLVGSLLLGLSACADAMLEPSLMEPGSWVSFNYQGPLSGSFRAEGDWKSDLRGHTYAEAIRHTPPYSTALEVFGRLAHPGGMADQVQVMVPNRTVGSFGIDMTTCSHLYGDCPVVLVGLRASETGGSQQYRYFCVLQTGTIRVTDLSATRMQGEFSGSGYCNDRLGETERAPYAVTSGRFDVKLFDYRAGS